MLKYCGVLDGLKVLVVENEWIIADDIRRALTNEGAHVVGPAASVACALTLINTCRVDMAVLDVHLDGGADAYPIAEFLRACKIPFIFATGYDTFSIRHDFADSPHLRKPFKTDIISHFIAMIRSQAVHSKILSQTL